jgi:acyl-CoA thioesterase-2
MSQTDTAQPAALIDNLKSVVTVETIDTDLYRGMADPLSKGRVYGGQVIAQALNAATSTVEEGRVAHSLHAYFLRPGDADRPIIYRVERDFDGLRFANRRVIASQGGVPILNMATSFHTVEDGLEHAEPMPDVPQPEELPSDPELARTMGEQLPSAFADFLRKPRAIEWRRHSGMALATGEGAPPRQSAWFKTAAPIGDDPVLNRTVLAYASDMMLLSTALLPHGVNWFTHKMRGASVDHALWFHADARVDDWHLFTTDSPWAGRARGFNRGRIYTRDGRLVADTAQEGLIRVIGKNE